ncbi:MAG: hypothetical protein R2685_10580 [Candidatus Nitrosocosmicus sp.]|nr:hypothetical protein [Candidatus Nitrosocosmicus sp.]
MTKTTKIQISDAVTVYILNKWKCFAEVYYDLTISQSILPTIKRSIESKLECEILMVSIDHILNVIEFYIIGNEASEAPQEPRDVLE